MIRLILPAFIFFMFVFEGTVMQVFVPEMFSETYVAIPRFALIIILFVACFMKRSTALMYGMIFGLLMDVIYTHYIGVYFFTFAFTAYVIASVASLCKKHFMIVIFLILLGVAMLEFQVYGLYTAMGAAHATVNEFMTNILWSTLLLNGIAVALLYYPLNKIVTLVLNKKVSDEHHTI